MNYRITKDERGMSHVLMIILAVIVLGGVGYAGWMVKNKDSGSNASLSKTEKNALKASEKECLKELDNDKDLCKFISSWSYNNKYAVDMTSTDAGTTTSMSMKIDGNNTYMKMSGEMAYEVISIGDTTYTKAGETWWKRTTKPTATDITPKVDKSEFKFEQPKAGEPETAKTKYVKVGMEACGKKNCFKYKIVDPADPASTQFIWFDDDDYLIRKMRIESKDGSSEMVFSYDNVKVSVPSPVKELREDQYIMPGQSEPTTVPSTPDGSAEAAAALSAMQAEMNAGQTPDEE